MSAKGKGKSKRNGSEKSRSRDNGKEKLSIVEKDPILEATPQVLRTQAIEETIRKTNTAANIQDHEIEAMIRLAKKGDNPADLTRVVVALKVQIVSTSILTQRKNHLSLR